MTDLLNVSQNTRFEIKCGAKTVDWLVNKTMVNKFRIENGSVYGYQRDVNDSHVGKIVEYIRDSMEANEFYFPSCVVCSIPKENALLEKNEKECFVVDGQHRVEAFRRIKERDTMLYEKIKNFSIPVTMLVNVDEDFEITTFITINKKTRKVDTSLALALTNKLRKLNDEDDVVKVDFLAIELAHNLNEDLNSLWYNQIAFEGSAKENNCLLSLNSFVKAVRRVVRTLDKIGYLQLKEIDNDSVPRVIESIKFVLNSIWENVRRKWPDLFEKEYYQNTIILGPIGFGSICKYVSYQLSESPKKKQSIDDIKNYIICLKYSSEVWMKGGVFSKYSSESGYSKIATMLVESYLKH